MHDSSDLDPDDDALSRALDDDLSAAERADLDRRLATDPNLRHRFEVMAGVVELLRTQPVPMTAAAVDEQVTQVLAQTHGNPAPEPGRVLPLPRRPRRVGWGIGLSAAAVLLTTATAFTIRHVVDDPAVPVDLAQGAAPLDSVESQAPADSDQAATPAGGVNGDERDAPAAVTARAPESAAEALSGNGGMVAGSQRGNTATTVRSGTAATPQEIDDRTEPRFATLDDLLTEARHRALIPPGATPTASVGSSPATASGVDPLCGSDLEAVARLADEPVRWGPRIAPTTGNRLLVVSTETCVIRADLRW